MRLSIVPVFCLACADGGFPDPEPGGPGAAHPAEAALERLNRADEDGRLVFYTRADVAAELTAGGALAADDEREVWRFAVPDAVLARGEPIELDLSDPGIHITAHLPDPDCRPPDPCPMVTLTRAEDGRLSVVGDGTIQAGPDGERRLFFVLVATFTMESGVHGTMRYRGGAYGVEAP